MKDLDCPYCGHQQDVCHDDGFGYSEDELHQVECEGCGKTYGFRTSICYYYEPEPTPCLNGEPHQWRESYRRYYGSDGCRDVPYWQCICCEKETKKQPEANQSPDDSRGSE